MFKENLEARYYTDPAIYRQEQSGIFNSNWQLIAPRSRFVEKGDYVATDIAGTKVFVVLGEDGELRGFRNLCRHRGAMLLEPGQGRCRSIRCPYHNWVYRLDGSLERAPWFSHADGEESLTLEDWPLHDISVALWRGLVFACVESPTALTDQLGGLLNEIEQDPIEDYHWTEQRTLVFDANWKIYTDNFVEGYHIPGIHPEFFKAIDFEQFETTAKDNLVRMTAPTKGNLFYRGRWLWMWPNWTLSFFNGGMNTSRINPLGVDRTELIYDFYFTDLSDEAREARQDTIHRNLAVIEQDFDICTHIHQNYLSGGYQPGPLSPRHEKGVHLFQKLVKEHLYSAGEAKPN